MLLEQLGNNRIGSPFAAQFHNGVMHRLEIAERHATLAGLELLNSLAQ